MLTLANRLSNIIFYLEIRSDVPPDFNRPSSFAVADQSGSCEIDSQCLYPCENDPFQKRTQPELF